MAAGPTGRATSASGVLGASVVRAAAAPITLGLRWARHGLAPAKEEIPQPRFNLALASKIALDDLFFVSELASANGLHLS